MSDERKKAKSRKATDELQADVAWRLGFKPGEIAVFENPDGAYLVAKDGNRLLLKDDGTVAGWYGDEAPNPTFPLIRPTVEIDESDVEEIDGPIDLPREPGEERLPADDAGANIALTQPVEGAQDDEGGPDAVIDNQAAAIAAERDVEARADAKAAEKKPSPPPRPSTNKK